MKTLVRYSVFLFLAFLISVVNFNATAAGPKYDVLAFSDQYFCATVYPTAYVNVGTFSIFETDKKGFKKNQVETIIITCPANFEFNPVAAHSVTFTAGKDITSVTLDAVTAATITITVDCGGDANLADAVIFNDFEIRATAAGTGNVLRLDGAGGTFVIDGSIDKPTDAESLGYLFANTPMAYDSSEVYTVTTADIKKTCPTDQGILEIEVSMQGNCPDSVTRFDFNTSGTTDPAGDLVSASVYYTGITRGFATSTLFGTVAAPNGAFTITGSQRLTSAADDYYFYLVYDVNAAATVGNTVDARLDSFKVTDIFRSDMDVADPVGSRTIIDTVCLQPDMPNPSANPQLVKSGSLIIPMDLKIGRAHV